MRIIWIAVFRQHRFRVELDAENRQAAVGDAHDVPVGGFSGDRERIRQCFPLQDQGMVSADSHDRGHIPEDRTAGGDMHIGFFAVHRTMGGADHPAAVGLADGLMAETDAQDGDPAAQLLDGRDADPGVFGVARSRRDDDVAGIQVDDPGNIDLVVADHLDLRVDRPGILIEVIGKGIVIVDYQNHLISPAPWIALSIALALFSDSANSRAGTESATMPAPAWK